MFVNVVKVVFIEEKNDTVIKLLFVVQYILFFQLS